MNGIIRVWKKDRGKAILALVCSLLVPVACNAVLLIATSTYISIQMTCPMALCLPTLLCVEGKADITSNGWKILRGLMVLCIAVTCYGCVLQVEIDQAAMYDGRIATETIMDGVVRRLEDEGYLEGDYELCFVGRPAENPMFRTTDIYKKANQYAKFGEWNMKTDCTRMSYQGVLRFLYQINFTYCPDDKYEQIIAEEAVRQMPCFPSNDSIIEKDGIVVIKISNTY